jgi:hypothetical protein
MERIVLGLAAAFALAQTAAFAQSSAPPKEATYIMDTDWKGVLSAAPNGVDHQLRVIDMGKYNLAVGIVHRGPTGGAARGRGRGAMAGGGGAGRGGKDGATKAAAERCGEQVPPESITTPATYTGISHDDTAESYVIVSGEGTLITGGRIVNGTRSGPESEVTKILNGPSCSGRMVGDVVARKVKPLDVILIPPGVPHGWAEIADHVDYLSVRPDPDHVLQTGYVNPALKK